MGWKFQLDTYPHPPYWFQFPKLLDQTHSSHYTGGMHFERDLAPGEGRIVVSGCRGVFRVLWDAPPRKCDGTCSTGMMGRMIGWVWWAGIAGKAWSACATTCYLCLVCACHLITPLTASNSQLFQPTFPSVPPSAHWGVSWPRVCIGNVLSSAIGETLETDFSCLGFEIGPEGYFRGAAYVLSSRL